MKTARYEMTPPDIAIVTTCMGRLHHLKQSLPRFLDQDFQHFAVYVVDWSSPDGLAEWIRRERPPRTEIISVPGKEYFNLSAARNAGGRQACAHGAGLLAFVDADILLPPDFLAGNWARAEDARRRYGNRFFLQTREVETANGEKDPAIWGSCLVPAATWQIYEYNEKFISYGMEDNELYSLWAEDQITHLAMYVEGVTSIPHSDEERMRYYRESPEDIPRLKRENKAFYRGENVDLY